MSTDDPYSQLFSSFQLWPFWSEEFFREPLRIIDVSCWSSSSTFSNITYSTLLWFSVDDKWDEEIWRKANVIKQMIRPIRLKPIKQINMIWWDDFQVLNWWRNCLRDILNQLRWSLVDVTSGWRQKPVRKSETEKSINEKRKTSKILPSQDDEHWQQSLLVVLVEQQGKHWWLNVSNANG